MHCTNCGAELKSADAKFCGKCGCGKNTSTNTNQTYLSDVQNTPAQNDIERSSTGVSQNDWIDDGFDGSNMGYLDLNISDLGKKKESLYKKYKTSKEYNPTWLRKRSQSIILDGDDFPLITNWVDKIPVQTSKTFQQSLKIVMEQVIWFGIFGLITFIFSNNEKPINPALQAFFFGYVFYVYGSYKRPERFFKALGSSILILLLYRPLFLGKYVDFSGFPLAFPIVILSFGDKNATALGTSGLDGFTYAGLSFIYTYVLLFIVFIIHWFIKKHSKVEVVISKKNLFFRSNTQKSGWEYTKKIITILFNPFNIIAMKEIRDRIQYNRMSAKEGMMYDFARIPFDRGVVSLVKKENKTTNGYCLAGGLTIIGLMTGVLAPLFIPIAIFIAIKTSRYKGTFTINMIVDREITEGSWFKINNINVIKLVKVTPEMARCFPDFIEKN